VVVAVASGVVVGWAVGVGLGTGRRRPGVVLSPVCCMGDCGIGGLHNAFGAGGERA